MKCLNRLFHPVICFLLAVLLTGCAGRPDRQNSTTPTSPVQQNAFLYVGNRGSGNVSGFRINSDGTLTALNNSPFSIPPAISARGRQLFASGNGTVGAFSIDANTGSLTHLQDTTVPGGGPVIAADDTNVYVNGTDAAGNFVIYGFTHSSADGTLAPLIGSPFFCGDRTDLQDQPISMAIHTQLLMVDGNSGDRLSTGNLTAYPRSQGGRLAPMKKASSGASTSIAIHPNGKLVYTADVSQGQGGLLQLLIAPDGTITGQMSLYQIDVDGSYIALAVDPSGKYLVIVEETPALVTRLKVFTINETSGDLTAVGSPVVTGGVGGNFVAFGPTGANVYVVNGGGANPSNDISVFSVDHASGALTKIQSVPTGGTAPQNISIALP